MLHGRPPRQQFALMNVVQSVSARTCGQNTIPLSLNFLRKNQRGGKRVRGERRENLKPQENIEEPCPPVIQVHVFVLLFLLIDSVGISK